MADQAVNQIREWLMELAYDQWMKDVRTQIVVNPETAKEGEPETGGAFREAKQLEYYGWIDILNGDPGGFRYRLNPCGREAWESYLKEKERDPSAAALSR